MNTSTTLPTNYLINLLNNTSSGHPRFMLFLGAGASRESNVTTASEMIAQWREQYKTVHSIDDPELRKLKWYDQEDEYPCLFEALYDQPSQRREFIESCLKEAHPSWGYIYLVELIRREIFNTVFTTNFDDLLNEACYLYSKEIRPIVCAHDSSIKSVRITNRRLKIFKLHGDFLFDSLRNTKAEVKFLDSSMESKLKQCSNEYGMIVVGYSGRDNSVMATLAKLLQDSDSFPHGIYWCIQNGTEPSSRVLDLCNHEKVKLVSIDGFDSFMSEVYGALYPEPPVFFAKPYQAAVDRLQQLIERLKTPPAEIGLSQTQPRIPGTLSRHVEVLQQSLMKGPDETIFRAIEIPTPLLVWHYLSTDNNESARTTVQKLLDEELDKESVDLALATLRFEWNDGLAQFLTNRLKSINGPIHDFAEQINHAVVTLIAKENYHLAGHFVNAFDDLMTGVGGELREFFLINKAQLLRHQRKPLTKEIETGLRTIEKTSSASLSVFGVLIVLGEYEKAIECLTESPNWAAPLTSPSLVLSWPITRLLPKSCVQRLKRLVTDAETARQESSKRAAANDIRPVDKGEQQTRNGNPRKRKGK
jgi:hypothetical protein